MRNSFVLFLGIVIIIYCAINYYIGLRGWQTLSKLVPFLNGKFYWIVFWVLASSYIIGRFIRNFLPYSVSSILTLIGSYWLGIMFYSFLIVLLIDLVRLFNKAFGLITINTISSLNIVQIIGIAAIAIIASIMAYGTWSAKSPKVAHYDITIAKQAGNLKTLHIVALSDIHLGVVVDAKQIKKAASIINDLKPDLVLLAGDTVDEDIDIFKEKDMAELFSGIKSKMGNYAILGNHEYISGHTDEAIHYIEKSGFKVLRDNYVKINDDFYLIGRDDKSGERMAGRPRKNLNELLKDVDKSLPAILLDHQPSNLSEPQENGVDLQISGHTHGGQLFPIELITRKIFEDDYGYLKKGNLQVIVSSGFGTWGPPVRIGSRAEVVDIIVRFK